MILLEIYCSLEQWKNLQIEQELTKLRPAMVMVAPFLIHAVENNKILMVKMA